MAKAFRQLTRRAQSRTAARSPRTNWALRLNKLEIMLFELNSRLVRQIHSEVPQGSSPSEFDTDFLEAAEEFRQHLTAVVSGG